MVRAGSQDLAGPGTEARLAVAEHDLAAPERDYRPRMKEVLVMQGLIRSAAVRAPQMGVGPAERAELGRLARDAGLIDAA